MERLPITPGIRTSSWLLIASLALSVGVAHAASVSRAAIAKSARAEAAAAGTHARTPIVRPNSGSPSTTVVKPGVLGTWEISNFETNGSGKIGDAATASGSDGDFRPGPASPPLGTGSFGQKIGTDGDDGTRMRTTAYNGQLLSSLRALRYSTYVSQFIDGQATYVQIFADTTGDGTADEILFFEPVYQTGAYSGDAVPNQGAPVLNTWQSWDALAGGWWLASENAGGPPLHTLANYVAGHPTATFATDVPSLRFTAGFGAGAWDNFRGAFDNVQVNKDLYNFESYPVNNIDTGIGYSTIQAAISDATTMNGNHIVVDAGTYNENVVLNKSLSLKGAQSSVNACGRVATESIVLAANPTNPVLDIPAGGSTIVIDGFTFDQNNGNPLASVFQELNPTPNIQFKNNRIIRFQGSGLWFNRGATDGVVDGNAIDGAAMVGNGQLLFMNGPQPFGGIDITNNCLDNSIATGWFVDGNRNVGVSGANRPIITGNKFRNNRGSAVNVGSRSLDSALVANNLFQNNTADGFQGGPSRSRIQGNTFDNNHRFGLALTSFGNMGAGRGAFADTVVDNYFLGNDSTGVLISATQPAGNAASIHTNHNDIVGNGDGVHGGYGVEYHGTETIDVGCNWWGHIDGPDYPPANPNPPGDNLLASSATYTPWLDGSISGSPNCNQFPPTPTTTTLSSNVNPSTCGQAVELTATVSPSAATGTVEFFDGATSLGTSSVTGGVATLVTSTLPAGHRPLTAQYSGDGDYSPSTSNVYVQNVHCTPSGTTTVLTTPCNTQGWGPANVAGGGTVGITATYPHVTGSLEFNTVDGNSKADYAHLNPSNDLLSTLTALAVDLYRNSSSTSPGHLLPAVRITVDNGQATDRFSYLIWEAVYNGVPTAPTNSWDTYDLFKGKFWMRAFKTSRPTQQINATRTIAEWMEPGVVVEGTDTSNVVGPNARVVEYEVGVGSGWSGTFAGAADNFRIGFNDADNVYDFEVAQVTSIALSAPATSNCGDKVVLSADLSPAGLSATLDFYDGATLIGSQAVDANGHAELSLANLTIGSHSFTATYAGAPCVNPATSNKVAHQVNRIVTTTTLDIDPAKSSYGGKVTLTATVSPSDASGMVDFLDGPTGSPKSLFKADPGVSAFQSDPTPVNIGMRFSSDQAGFVTSLRYYKDAANAGPHTVSLWTENGTLLASEPYAPPPGAGWQDVPLTTPVAIAANQIYVVSYHSSTGFTYTVNYFDGHAEDNVPLHAPANGPGSPNGVYQYAATPQFPTLNYIGSNYWVDVAFTPGTSLGSVAVAGGQAVLSTTTLAVGTHSIAAVYGGDACHVASSSVKGAQEVNRAASNVTLVSDNNPSNVGEKVNFTATVSPSDATGSIDFYDGVTLLKSSPIVAGQASTSISDLSAGNHSITAVYGGDTNYLGDTSNKVDQAVGLNPTTTTLDATPNPSTCGQKVTFTATVSPAAATGTVEFFDGTVSMGSAPVVSGSASISVDTLSTFFSPHSITATYSGDLTYASSTSDKVIQVVNGNPTTTTLNTSSGPVKEGTKVTLTATVAPPAATGTVEFLDGMTSLGSEPIVAGQATKSLTALSPGYHLFQAIYSGDACYASSYSDTSGQMVNPDLDPVVHLDAPNGGQSIPLGDQVKIAWTATDDNAVIYVDLFISRTGNAGPWEKIASMEANDGTYDWTATGPGTTHPDGTQDYTVFFRVDAYDAAMNMGTDMSDAGSSLFDSAVETLLALFQANPSGAGVELRWQFRVSEAGSDVSLQRAESREGPWLALAAETRRDGDVTVAMDRSSLPHHTYFYRLVVKEPSGGSYVFGPVTATTNAAVVDFALSPLTPNPSPGRTRVDFALPRESSIRLGIVDLQGREVALLANGVYAPGRHQVVWNGTSDRGAVPVGIYFVKLQAAGKTLVRRLCIAR